MFNIGGGELLVILLVALLVLGPTKLPGAVREAGKWLGELRQMSSGFQSEVRRAFDEADAEPAPSATPAVTDQAATDQASIPSPASNGESPPGDDEAAEDDAADADAPGS